MVEGGNIREKAGRLLTFFLHRLHGCVMILDSDAALRELRRGVVSTLAMQASLLDADQSTFDRIRELAWHLEEVASRHHPSGPRAPHVRLITRVDTLRDCLQLVGPEGERLTSPEMLQTLVSWLHEVVRVEEGSPE